jgi:tetratricopeptide (TPR) repeat protein
MSQDAAEFGARLRAYRVAAGVSQEELAAHSGLSVRAISDLERGRTRRPRKDSLARIADALNLSETARADLFAQASRRFGNVHPVPHELPNTVPDFVGRTGELDELTALIGDAGGPVLISAIGGTPGVGKTALALHWAQRSAASFPDGQLYVDLHGYDRQRPLAAAAALARFFRSLGVPGSDIPADEAELAARYRSLLAGKRMLVVLDNAHDADQVRPLLPGTSTCVTLVTSRDSLGGLVAREGARRLDLDVLPVRDAVALLERLIGDRAAADSAMTRALALACDRLPLALRVAAEAVAGRRTEPLSGYLAELNDQQWLDKLRTADDSRTAVRTVFSWSYRHLDADAAAGFRMAGLHPGPGFGRPAIAALCDTTPERAGQILDLLGRAYLIQPGGPGRYHMHDLLRAYAGELIKPDERTPAGTRLLDFYLQTAANAMDLAYPGDAAIRPAVPRSCPLRLTFEDAAAARAWLDTERTNLVAATVYAALEKMAWHASRMSGTLFRYFDAGGYMAEAQTVHEHARSAAAAAGDHAGEATALVSLAASDFRAGRLQQAADGYRQAIRLSAQLGDQAGQARAEHNLGLIDGQRGDYGTAGVHFEHALALYQEIADQTGEGRALADLGMIEMGQGRYQQAADYYGRALALCRETGDRLAEGRILARQGRIGLHMGHLRQAASNLEQALVTCAENGERHTEAYVLGVLGLVRLRQEDYERAGASLRRALSLSDEIQYPSGTSDALNHLGQLDFRLGHPEAAIDLLNQSAAVAREIGDPEREAEALIALGEVLLATGQPKSARERYDAALGLVSGGHERYHEARARQGLGNAHHALHDVEQAKYHWRQADAIYADLGVVDAPAAGAAGGSPYRQQRP